MSDETNWTARITGVEQKEDGNWRVRVHVDGTPDQAGVVLRFPVPVDRARAWGAEVGRKVLISMSLKAAVPAADE